MFLSTSKTLTKSSGGIFSVSTSKRKSLPVPLLNSQRFRELARAFKLRTLTRQTVIQVTNVGKFSKVFHQLHKMKKNV